MNQGAPQSGRAGVVAANARRFLPLLPVLALSGVCALGLAGVPLPREKPVAALDYQVSPDGAWLAVSSARRGDPEARAWLVPIDDGELRPLESTVVADAGLVWDSQGRLRVQVVDRARGVPELRWLDPATQQVLESTRDRDRMRTELSAGASWASIEERKGSEGRVVHDVEWLAKKQHYEFSMRKDGSCQVSTRPGLVFHELRAGAQTLLVRRDMESGESKELTHLDAATLEWSLAPDGVGVLLLEAGTERRARVIDAEGGELLHGPWVVDEARWIEGAGSRYLGLTRGARRVVLDTLRDREVDFGADDGAWPRVVALDDGRFVVDEGARIALWSAELRPQRTLFERDLALAVVRH